MTKYKVLFVEDDEAMAYATKYFLEQLNYDVTHCTNAHLALKEFMKNDFDIFISDVVLPGNMDGLELVRAIRSENKQIPILIISSEIKDEDRIAGMENGADCYIPKPCNFDELHLRMRVFLKHTYKKPTTAQTLFRIGGYEFDYSLPALEDENDTHFLTQREADLLRYMYMNEGRVLRRDDILIDLWGKSDLFLGRSLNVFINKLRKYFRNQPNVEIQTLYGVGFKLNVYSGKEKPKPRKEIIEFSQVNQYNENMRFG